MSRPHPWEAHYPPGLDWGAPVPQITLPALLDRAVAAHARRSAIQTPTETLTYADLAGRADRLARHLAALGVGPGEAVGLLLPNTPAHPVSFFATLRTGARVVHLTPLDPARAVIRKLGDSGARTLITTDLPGVLPQALAARDAGACDQLLILPDRAPDTLDGPPRDWPAVGPEDVALLQYTGGTTGLPRAAMLTHGNLTATVAIYNAWNRAWGRPLGPGDRMMGALPLFHIYALTAVLLRTLDCGAEILLRQRFDADAALRDIEHGGCTHFPGVPTMWISLANHPRIAQADLSSLRSANSGGAALPAEVAERFAALTGLTLGGGWGMTETSPAGTNLLPDRPHGPGEIGVPLPNVELEVVALDDKRRVLPPGEVGELRVRGPNVFRGYRNRPEESASAFVDGWFLTGDVGFMSPDGVFTIVDRKKDMLISGGFNVYPRAVEEAIHEHPDVQEAAVVGVPDPYRGQAAKAFVALREGADPLTLEGLRAFLADRLGRHELPAALELRESLPHTPVGKLDKRALREEA